MELLNAIIMLSVLTVAFYFIFKKEQIEKDDNLKKIRTCQNQVNLQKNKLSKNSKEEVKEKVNNSEGVDVFAIQKELERRRKILSSVNEVLDNSIYFEPIAKWKEKNIYKFIFLNNKEIFEFEDIMPPENQKIGVDDDFLCFQQLFYKKIKDDKKIEFLLNKFENIKGDKIEYNII